MTADSKRDLMTDMTGRRVDRRRLLQGAAALGMSIPALSGAFAIPGRAYFASAQDANDGILTISQEQQQTWVRNFNPFLPESQGSRWPTNAGIHEPMIIYNTATSKIEPWLATEWAFNADNTVLTFTIRDGVTWSDGEPFTADDVAFTFNLIKDTPGLTSPSGTTAAFGDTGYLASIEATDPKTVTFTFSRVYTPALYDLGMQPIAPKHIWEKVADPVTETNENPVGTGPFTNVTRFEAQVWQLEKNDTYWQEGLPLFQGIRFPAYATNDAANLATVNGENDWAGNFIPDVQKTFVDKDPEHNHYWFPATGDTVQLYAQTTKAPWDDVNVRKAMSMAIDRDQIVQIAMFDYTHPADASGMSDKYDSWKDPAVIDAATWTKRDVDAANKLLDDGGYVMDGDTRKTKDGTPMEYDLNVVTGWSDWVSSCEIMAQNLAEIGIKATVKPYDVAAWQERVQLGNFDLSIGWSSGGPTPMNFYRGVMSSEVLKPVGEVGTENWQRFSTPEADDLLDKFVATSDEAEQKDIVNQLQKIYSDNAPAIPLFPGPQWGEFNTARFTGFPNEDDPYALLSTYAFPDRLLVMAKIKPV
jgi:peptide/nickel transport system substrate-binding protein